MSEFAQLETTEEMQQSHYDPHQQPRTQRDPNDHTIYIGKKPAMSYVIAVVTQFNNGSSEVKVKARGRCISTAVDVTQIVKNRFMPTLQITDIKLSTEELMSEDGRTSKVSSMEITMVK